jgi:hypothetical protein
MRVKVETAAGKAAAVTGGDVFDLVKGAEVAATVKLSGVWLSSSGFGLAWRSGCEGSCWGPFF